MAVYLLVGIIVMFVLEKFDTSERSTGEKVMLGILIVVFYPLIPIWFLMIMKKSEDEK